MADEKTMPELVSRKEAKEKGLKRYFTGKGCPHSHVVERFTTTGRCVECNKIKCSTWQANNKDLAKEQGRKWAAENADHLREYHREWYHRDVEARRTKLRNRRASNPAELKKHNERNAKWREENPNYFVEWKKKNPDKARRLSKLSKHRRRAIEKKAVGSFTQYDLERMYLMQKGKCAYCRKPLRGKYQVDHITALSKDGTNYARNIQLLCENVKGQRSCNQLKRDADPIDFARSLGLLL